MGSQRLDGSADHGGTKVGRNVSKNLGVFVVGDGLDNGLGSLGGVVTEEDTGANEDTVTAKLHAQSGIGGGGNTSSGEVDDGKSALLGGDLEQIERSTNLLGVGVELNLGHVSSLVDLGLDGSHVLDGLGDITSSGLTLGSDEGSSLVDSSESLAQVLGTADEGDLEVSLVDVVELVGGGQNLGLVNVINTNLLDDLGLDKVADSALGHDGDRNASHDLLDHSGVGHSSDSSVGSDVGGDLLKSHDGNSTGLLGNLGLLGVDNVHDDAALEHLGQTGLQLELLLKRLLDRHCDGCVCVLVTTGVMWWDGGVGVGNNYILVGEKNDSGGKFQTLTEVGSFCRRKAGLFDFGAKWDAISGKKRPMAG